MNLMGHHGPMALVGTIKKKYITLLFLKFLFDVKFINSAL